MNSPSLLRFLARDTQPYANGDDAVSSSSRPKSRPVFTDSLIRYRNGMVG